ncbi:MAG: NAD+ kinase [Verrucomicrobiales bacterium]|jgi:NAD+ kinase
MDGPLTGIIVNTEKPGAADVLQQLLAKFEAAGIETRLEEKTAQLIGKSDGRNVLELMDEIDLVVLLGGDGTILHFVEAVGARVKPIAAINIGTLGFLTLATTERLDEVVSLIAERAYKLSQRSVIAVRVFEDGQLTKEWFALNEVSVSRGGVSRLVRVQAKVNGEFLTRFSGDGLIVATPTGSTAYSLSAGGPLIEPEAEVFVVTPVCPHSLASRPLVVSQKSIIEIEAPEQRDAVFMTVDGQDVHRVGSATRLEIRRADFTVPLVTSAQHSFYGVLRKKLEWSGSNS